jgi:hypothetical protein
MMAEIWVVGVLGDVFEFLLNGATDTAELRDTGYSALASHSFVQTGSVQQVQRGLLVELGLPEMIGGSGADCLDVVEIRLQKMFSNE